MSEGHRVPVVSRSVRQSILASCIVVPSTGPVENTVNTDEAAADAINEQMVRQMERRRQQQAERRKTTPPLPDHERRVTCSFCFQPGDHPTPRHCMWALER